MKSDKRLFNDGWSFSLWNPGNQEEEMGWKAVELPHDWLIYNTNDLYKDGEGRYRKEFQVSQEELDKKRMFLRFDGVYMDASISINGKSAFEWKYGYSTFEFEITEFLMAGSNEILVKVLYLAPNSRWYSGAGIYRNVWLKTTAENRIISDGIYITPIRLEGSDTWSVEVDTEIERKSKTPLILSHTIYDAMGNTVASCEDSVENEGACCERTGNITVSPFQFMYAESPKLWDIAQPNLYTLKTRLLEDGEVIGIEENRFGFRTIAFDPEDGFSINGKRQKLFGVCNHHDLGCLGSAVSKVALKRQFELMLDMGVNAIRTAHNMPAPELMEVADEMGMLIVSESFDCWKNSKTKNDYARFFSDWHEKDVASWVRRDRNCPSVIMWTIGNEISDTHITDKGVDTAKELMELVWSHDPKGHAPVTIGSNYMPWENARKVADVLKLAGYNYGDKLYAADHEEHPDWMIYGSETSSIVQSRGIYHFPMSQSLLADDDEQCSSLGNSATSWGAKSIEYCIISDRDAPFSAGQFLWSGIDYIGEPTPYHTKNSYFGQVDTAGFRKDSFYMYQAEWTDYKKNPMVHVLPYWDFSPGQIIDLRVCSNAPKVELFFNDESVGTFDIDHAKGQKLFGDFQLPYVQGTIRAVAYDEKGEIIAEDLQRSFGDATKVVLSADKKSLACDGRDLIFVEITVVDENGVAVENANNRINVSVSGAGRLMGMDNGDSTDFEQYKTTSRRLFSGKLLAVIAGSGELGEILVTAASEGLEPATLTLISEPGEIPVGASEIYSQMATGVAAAATGFDPMEVPIRKIELISEAGCALSDTLKNLRVTAKILPENATYNDLEWRVANAAGVDSDIVSLEVEEGGNAVTLTALGDGEFYLRCMTKNGKEKTNLISLLGFTVTGLGTLYLNPYKFVSGSLYSASNLDLTNGNDRGVATDRVNESHVGFQNIDFGGFGSDEVTIPIFSLSPEKFPVQIWEGMPGEEGSELLTTQIYTKGSVWNTYQEQSFKLPRKLKGVTTFCIVVGLKVHIKGFQFQEPQKAYEQLETTQYSHLYGDTFSIKEDAIEGIGNNVSILFEDMDFGENGLSKIRISGRTPLEKNAIQINFSGEDSPLMVEFDQSGEYVTREFGLKNIKGKHTVTFLFLPGCNFDFKWFQFTEMN